MKLSPRFLPYSIGAEGHVYRHLISVGHENSAAGYLATCPSNKAGSRFGGLSAGANYEDGRQFCRACVRGLRYSSRKKYHRSSYSYLRYSKISISLTDAKRSYSPCSVCNP